MRTMSADGPAKHMKHEYSGQPSARLVFMRAQIHARPRGSGRRSATGPAGAPNAIRHRSMTRGAYGVRIAGDQRVEISEMGQFSVERTSSMLINGLTVMRR